MVSPMNESIFNRGYGPGMPDSEPDPMEAGPGYWPTFLDTPPAQAERTSARFVVIPVPYDATTSYKSGARHGPTAIIQASRHLEDYDLELGRDMSLVGIHTAPEIAPAADPETMVSRVLDTVLAVATEGKIPALLGGEHSIAVGAVQALVQLFPDLSVLFLDAHADMRDSYMGTRWGHASVARRLHVACPITLAGIRSLSAEELSYIEKSNVPAFFWDGAPVDTTELAGAVAKSLTERVYISLDLDVLDPSIMSAVGTPEPGGMSWGHLTGLIRAIGERREIVGFDISELSPVEGPEACTFTAAKLAYKLMGYATAGTVLE